MTHICHTSNISLPADNSTKFFTVEIVTFSGERYTEEIEAYTAEEAQEIAASLYFDVDYVMIQGFCIY